MIVAIILGVLIGIGAHNVLAGIGGFLFWMVLVIAMDANRNDR